MMATAGNCQHLDSNWKQSQAVLTWDTTQALMEDGVVLAWSWPGRDGLALPMPSTSYIEVTGQATANDSEQRLLSVRS
jgi:hypothetical protein